MGRLVAHEMYHIESQDRGHSRNGVAEAAVSSRELVSEHFEFARDALAKLHVPAPAPAPATEDGFDTIDTDDSVGR